MAPTRYRRVSSRGALSYISVIKAPLSYFTDACTRHVKHAGESDHQLPLTIHTRVRRLALTTRSRNLSEIVGSILHSKVMGTVRTRPITSGRIIITVFDTVLSDMVDYQMIGSIGRMIYFNIMSSMYSRDCQVSHTGGNPRFTTEPGHQDHINSPRLRW